MILTIDIGNTNIVLGGFEGEKLEFISRISTDSHKTDCEYAAMLKTILGLYSVTKAVFRAQSFLRSFRRSLTLS